MHFSWDPKKAARNARDHGITFEEAKEVFETAAPVLEEADIEHSNDEDRFWTIGPVVRGLVVVVWAEWEGDTIRIISARFAEPPERARYRKFLKGQR